MGLGIGLVVGGAALDVASAAAMAFSAGGVTPLSAAGIMSGTGSVIAGFGFIDVACD